MIENETMYLTFSCWILIKAAIENDEVFNNNTEQMCNQTD